MVFLNRTVLSLGLVAGAAFACTPDEDPSPYVRADTPIETDNGYFTISLRAAEGRVWPEFIGPTAFAANIEVGPDPVPNDPQFKGERPEQPLELVLETGRPAWAEGPTDLKAKTWPVTADGRKWMVAVDFKAAGDWVFPLVVRDAKGRTDSAELVFHIEEQ